jgi:hypothetical protein
MELLLLEVSVLLLLVVVALQRRKLAAIEVARRKHTRLPK